MRGTEPQPGLMLGAAPAHRALVTGARIGELEGAERAVVMLGVGRGLVVCVTHRTHRLGLRRYSLRHFGQQ
ncbi:MAG: hypothetical protein HZB27_06680 [Meiothermus silvanus]|nr:hypothetical protein [Allomeiothermus silvanus]